MAIVELKQVHKTFLPGPVLVLRGIDLTIQPGEFVSIMGPSGSGKSTLLNLISALDVPTQGTIRVDDQDISALDDDALTLFRRTKIGLVFQFFNLLPTLDAMDNVLLPVLLGRRAAAADRDRAEQLLIEVGLKDRLRHRVQQLSGGEAQRVAIARALIQQPRLLLADEPTGNLDSHIGREILALLRRTCERHHTTIVMVTHDRAAADHGHRLVSLMDGVITGDQQIDHLGASDHSGHRGHRGHREVPA